MLKAVFVFIVLISVAQANTLEGKQVSLIVEIKGLIQKGEALTAKTLFKSGELSNGFYYEPTNKEMKIEIPENCKTFAQLAFTENLKYKIEGEVKKHEDYLTQPSFIQFHQGQSIRCEISK